MCLTSEQWGQVHSEVLITVEAALEDVGNAEGRSRGWVFDSAHEATARLDGHHNVLMSLAAQRISEGTTSTDRLRAAVRRAALWAPAVRDSRDMRWIEHLVEVGFEAPGDALRAMREAYADPQDKPEGQARWDALFERWEAAGQPDPAPEPLPWSPPALPSQLAEVGWSASSRASRLLRLPGRVVVWAHHGPIVGTRCADHVEVVSRGPRGDEIGVRIDAASGQVSDEPMSNAERDAIRRTEKPRSVSCADFTWQQLEGFGATPLGGDPRRDRTGSYGELHG